MPVQTELFDLTGQTALITGGGGGIGKAIAAAVIRHGGNVLIGSREKIKIDHVVNDLNSIAGRHAAAGAALDVGHNESVQLAVQQSVDTFGSLNIIVNCAGHSLKKPTTELADHEFNTLYDIHVTGSLRAAKAAFDIFHNQGSGCIINIASISSFVDLIEVAGYAAAKNAVLGLTRSLANEWATFGIRTNAIAPGFIPTDLNRHMIERTDRGRRIIEHTPMGRFGLPDEIAGAAVFLASPAAGFVNGHTIVVDGGFLACGIGSANATWDMGME